MHITIDEELERSITAEVTDYLNNIEHINDTVIHRIANIALAHLNHPKTDLGKYLDIHSELICTLYTFNLENHDNFIDSLRNYIRSTFYAAERMTAEDNERNAALSDYNKYAIRQLGHLENAQSPMEESDMNMQSGSGSHNRRVECYMDSPPVPVKSNEVLSALRKQEEATSTAQQSTITLADVVEVIGQIPADVDNEDLAEADQICSPDDMYSTEDDYNSHRSDVAGAVGGGDMDSSSVLPDLAKVNATQSNNSLEVGVLKIKYCKFLYSDLFCRGILCIGQIILMTLPEMHILAAL